jgi:TolB-like protein
MNKGNSFHIIQTKKVIFKISTTILLLTFLLFTPTTYALEIKTVAILPFTINAAEDLSFLREGILDMLSCRLSLKDKVEVIEKELVKKKIAEFKGNLSKETSLRIGSTLQADYVIMGSLTVVGSSVSLDAKILDVAQETQLAPFFSQSKGIDEIIPTVNQLAQDIKTKIWAPEIKRPESVPAPKDAVAEERIAKPIEKGVVTMEPFLTARVPFEIVGLDVGDMDGDGQNELVLIDHRNVFIYRFQGNRLVQSQKISGRRSDDYVSLDVADLDGNGKAEIYISNIIGDSMGSFVLEHVAGKFKALASGENWFFRIIKHPARGESLIGQRREISGSFTGYVYLLTLYKEKIIKGERFLLFPKANIFNFTMGDMEGSGKIDTVLLAENGDLILIGPDGEVDWEEEGGYGGSPTFIQNRAEYNGFHPEGELVFLSSRLLMYGMDSKGKQQLVLCRNELKTGRLFSRVRLFKSGRVLFLGKTGAGLTIRRQTGTLTKCVTDYQVKDIDSDGQSELVVAVTDPNKILGEKKSLVVVYNLK